MGNAEGNASGADSGVEEARQLFDLEDIGRTMHESWSRTKREQGYHGPGENCGRFRSYLNANCGQDFDGRVLWHCAMYHADLIPWGKLSERQKDINRHAFDALLEMLTQKVAAYTAELRRQLDQWPIKWRNTMDLFGKEMLAREAAEHSLAQAREALATLQAKLDERKSQ